MSKLRIAMSKNVAIIPARGGSKRIRHKNVREIWGKPLIAHTIEAAKASKFIDQVIVSTEDKTIKDISLKYGALVVDRPARLATDSAKTEPVLLHVLKELEKKGERIANIVLLQPTSPLRDCADIDMAFEQFKRERADSLVSVTEQYCLYWKDGQPANYSLDGYDKRPKLAPGNMEPLLKENGAIYICKRDIFVRNRNRIGGRISIFRMPEDKDIDLDTPLDWVRLEHIARRKKIGDPGVYVIAEIGCNHQGDFGTAIRMIDVARYCGVDAVKLQKRDNKHYLSSEQYNRPYDNPNSFGRTYGEHREYLEFSANEHQRLKTYAESLGLTYFVSVWDDHSAEDMADIGIEMLKIPSACINDNNLLRVVNKAGLPVIASIGMSDIKETDALVKKMSAVKELYIMQSTACYPCDHKDLNLNVIKTLKKRYRGRVKGVGFSGHHRGIAVDIGAVAMGATIIERHFTLDRAMKGTDHAASLEPESLRRLIRDIRDFESAKGDGIKQRLPCETDSWRKMRRYI